MKVEFLSLGVGNLLSPYLETWELQQALHNEVAAGIRDSTILLVEHESVYTAGRRTLTEEHPVDGTPVVRVDRGGKVTWHGPGQLVVYPIVALKAPLDVVEYVRTLERAVGSVCRTFGLAPVRIEGRSGVWFQGDGARPDRKVCAVGIRVARGVAMHGLALNCNPDLSAYSTIVPCGITDADVTSLSEELDRDVSVVEAAPLVQQALETYLPNVAVDRLASNGVDVA